jgi:putative membrane protein
MDLRRTRAQMRIQDLVHAETTFPVSLSLIVAVLLLLLGLLAIVSMSFGLGPLG